MNNIDDKLASTIALLRLKFIDGLDDRILQFEAILADLRKGCNQREALCDISALTHKISGIAATFGFPEMGAQARHLEEMIDNQIDTVPIQQIIHRVSPVLQAFLDDLESQI